LKRQTLLLAVLLAVIGLAAWNTLRVEPAEPAPAGGKPASAGAPQTPAAPTEPSALSLDAYPGPVADSAQTLSHFADTLEWQASAFREDLGIEVHVVTLAAPEQTSEALAAEVFGLRRVGEKAPTGGILVLLNPARREARIEVSYALEPVLPDALVGRIANDQLAPYAAYSFAGMAVMDALHFLKDFTTQQAIEGRLALDDQFRGRPAYAERARFLSGGAGASVKVPSADELAGRDFKARVADARRTRYAPGRDPLASAEALLRVQQDLAGDPTLELFTPGSRCMRRGYPVAPYEELERARKLAASKPWRVIEQGDRAVVTSDRPAPGFVPVLLAREGGLWRVDLVETWKNLFFGRDGNYRLENSNNPYTFGLAAFGSAGSHDVAPWKLGDASLEQVVAALEAKGGALNEFLLGEVLFCNCFLALDALRHYEEAARLGSNAPVIHDTLARRAEYLGFYDLAIEAYTRLGDPAALDVARVYAQKGEHAQAARSARRAVESNPYDHDALEALRGYLVAAGDADEAGEVEAKLAALAGSPDRKDRSLGIRFDPPAPTLVIDEPTLVGTTKVFDHSRFAVTLENPTGRPVQIVSVVLRSAGTGDASGLGDIKSYWTYPSPGNRIPAGESTRFDRTWGFTSDTRNDQLSYWFDVCWRGDGDVRQCRSERLDMFPN
jgi:TPM domain